MRQDKSAYLLDIVEVDKAKRVRCQADGCGHSVYARIHVVLVDGVFQVLGGDCFQRLYGEFLAGATSFYGGSTSSPTRLDDEMRRLLESNTAEFIERLEDRRLELEAQAARLAPMPVAAAHQPPSGPTSPGKTNLLPIEEPGADYEGPAMLRWKWIRDRECVGTRLTEYALRPKPSSHVDTVLTHYKSFNLNHTPYQFALKVELRHCLPKPVILQALHQLGLIEQA